ncbi:MAG: alpha/beta fold hydrolase [Candidatus Heimdallarchaeota archaeon]|nr:alpha/beta fold hydrolase [Candidatus Heimdallarchaeota archaeon]
MNFAKSSKQLKLLIFMEYTEMQPYSDDEIAQILTSSSMEEFPPIKPYIMGDPKHKVGIVLQHGFIGSPLDWVYLASYLSKSYRVILPLLPGHGEHARFLHGVNYEQWINSTNHAIEHLKYELEGRMIVLVGHSLGGSISLVIASRRNDVAGLVTLSSPVQYNILKRSLVKILGIIAGKKYYLYSTFIFHDESMYNNPYILFLDAYFHRVTFSTLRQLMLLLDKSLASLPEISVPYLNMHSIHDETVPYSNAQNIMERITSNRKTHIKLDKSYHVIIADTDKFRVREEVSKFISSLL